ncbi:MAG TPA: rhodanese-like domain-containing protein [Flavobacteriales bacterium]|nr:rhodanese-like domain-containing protein [Flavobacteriales bacterium]
MKSITVKELKAKMDAGEPFKLIDVREEYEAEIASIGAELVPLATVLENADKFKHDVPVIVHCRSGKRSATAIVQLEKQFGIQNLYNLEGGILAWAEEIDPGMDKY